MIPQRPRWPGHPALRCLLAIAVAARTFGSDAVLYGSRGSWSDLFRRPSESLTAPSVSNAFFCLMLMFPGFVLLGSFIAQLEGWTLVWRLGLASLITALLCGAVPLIVAILSNIRIRDAFQLKLSSPVAFGGAILLGFSLWPFAHEMVQITNELGIVTIGEDLIKLAQQLTKELRSIPLILVLLGLAVIPAVFEEFFFRGYLLSALRARTGTVQAVLISAVSFGLFHIIARDVLAIERLLPSMLMGIVLGWVCVRSDSVFPGMILHACNNGILLTISHYQKWLENQKWLESLGLSVEGQTHLPAGLLITAAIVAGIGMSLLIFAVRSTGGWGRTK